MKRALTLLATFVFAATVFAAKQPLTHESMWLMKRVGAPSLSPDGKWAVFSVVEPAYDEKEQVSDLWIVPADGNAKPRKITFSKGSESGVAWSDDSRRIAFSAKREGDDIAQIYVLDLTGGEAQRVTNVSTGARSPGFSPDGRSIAFVSSVFRGTADEDANKKAAKEAKDRKTNVRVYESFPIRAWDRWIDPEKQIHIFTQLLDSGSKPKDILGGTKLVTEPGFAGTGSGGEGGESINAEWSPDGQWLIFGVTTTRNTSAYSETSTDLYRVSASGGEPERMAFAEGSYGDPQFSPDGKTLYAKFNPNNKQPYNNDRLVAFDWPSMKNQRTVVGPPFDRSVDSYAITADGRTVYFTAEDAGLVKIYTAPTNGNGNASLAIEPERGVYDALNIAPAGPGLVMVGRWGSSTNPAELVRIDVAKKAHRNLTDFNVEQAANIDWQGPQHFWFTNPQGQRVHNFIVLPGNFDPKSKYPLFVLMHGGAANIDWQGPQHFWFTNSQGQRVHNFIVLPGNFDPNRKYPLFVLMHGGAANMWRDAISLRWNYHLLAKPGYIMLMTNYKGSTGFGEKFAQSIQGDPLRGPANDINQGADEAIRRFPFIDASRQAAGGASYGGHLANWMEATQTRYKALISHAGLSSLQTQWGSSDVIYHRELVLGGPSWEGGALWREQSPITYAGSFKTPILLSVGEKDYRVPMNNTLEMWASLQRMRVPSRLIVWPEENHWILNGENSKFFYQQVAEWLDRWVNRVETSAPQRASTMTTP